MKTHKHRGHQESTVRNSVRPLLLQPCSIYRKCVPSHPIRCPTAQPLPIPDLDKGPLLPLPVEQQAAGHLRAGEAQVALHETLHNGDVLPVGDGARW